MSFGRRSTGRNGSFGSKRVNEDKATDPEAARITAIGMIARREYASGELAAALARKGFLPDAIAPAIEALIEERLLDDQRYAHSLVRMLSGRGKGPRRVRAALTDVSLPESLIEDALASGPDWGQLAGEVRRRKFGAAMPDQWPEKARQMRFLQYRGFSKDHIASSLGSSGDDDFSETDS